jgi:glycosyltransferase involved in cell wall biosynthesis
MGRVAVVLKGYPRLSETFIAQEIHGLEQRGVDLTLVSLRHPTDRHTHPIHGEIKAPVLYLPEYLYQEPLRVLRAWWAIRRWPAWRQLKQLWWRDFRRDLTPNRGRRLGQALVLAHEIDPEVTELYAHFLHTPASVARYAALLLDLPWSVSAHAKDIWTTPDWEKREKLSDCQWAITCTAANAAHLAALAPPGRVELVYHGLDLERFPPIERAPPHNPATILTVGRAVPKKGLDDLLRALALLPRDIAWRLVHVGGGTLRKKLRRLADKLGIAERVTWAGAQPQQEVLAQYRKADLFVLASRIADDGDRDGLPNVLMEAQSQGLPCVATNVSAIPELVEDGVTGLLVPPGNPPALAKALAALIGDPARARALAEAGARRVRERFGHSANLDLLARRFGV